MEFEPLQISLRSVHSVSVMLIQFPMEEVIGKKDWCLLEDIGLNDSFFFPFGL